MRESLKHTLESLDGCLISQMFNIFTRASLQRWILGIALCVCVCVCVCVWVLEAGGDTSSLFFAISCFFAIILKNYKLLFEVGLIINSTPLTYVYPNTIEMCLTPNHLIFGRQLLYSSNTA